MTLTMSALPELDSDVEAGPELTRVTVTVGGLHVDVGLPTDTSIGAVIGDVIDFANEECALRSDVAEVRFDNSDGRWTLSRLGGDPLDLNTSLSEADIYDGDCLVVCEVGVPATPLLFDDVNDGMKSRLDRALWRDARMVAPFTVSVGAAMAAGLILAERSSVMAAAAGMAVGAAGIVAASLLPYRGVHGRGSAWLAMASLPLIVSGSLHVVPGGFGATSLPMALSLAALAALVVMLISGRGRSFSTAVITLAILGAPMSIALQIWNLPLRTAGALVAMMAVIVVYLAPRATILMSRLPIPPVPTAGEPLDDCDTQGGTAVEGVNAISKRAIPTEEDMIERVGRANQYLTGILCAATIIAAVGSYLAVDVSNGFFWQGTAFALTVATVLCLRGRGHHDLVQSAALIGGGLLTVTAVIVKTATFLDGWQLNAALSLMALTGLCVACGIAAPRVEFSPVMRRKVEIAEYIAIGLLFPLCFWITRLYAHFRELQI